MFLLGLLILLLVGQPDPGLYPGTAVRFAGADIVIHLQIAAALAILVARSLDFIPRRRAEQLNTPTGHSRKVLLDVLLELIARGVFTFNPPFSTVSWQQVLPHLSITKPAVKHVQRLLFVGRLQRSRCRQRLGKRTQT